PPVVARESRSVLVGQVNTDANICWRLRIEPRLRQDRECGSAGGRLPSATPATLGTWAKCRAVIEMRPDPRRHKPGLAARRFHCRREGRFPEHISNGRKD